MPTATHEEPKSTAAKPEETQKPETQKAPPPRALPPIAEVLQIAAGICTRVQSANSSPQDIANSAIAILEAIQDALKPAEDHTKEDKKTADAAKAR